MSTSSTEEKAEFQRSSFLSSLLSSNSLSDLPQKTEQLKKEVRDLNLELDILAQVCSKIDKDKTSNKRQRESDESDESTSNDEKYNSKRPKLDIPDTNYNNNYPVTKVDTERAYASIVAQQRQNQLARVNLQNPVAQSSYMSVFPPNELQQSDSDNLPEEQPFKIDPSQYPDKVWLVKKCGLKTGIFYPPICTPSHMSSGETVYFYVLVPHRAASATLASKYLNTFILHLPNGVIAKCEVHCQVQNSPVDVCIDNVDRPQKAVIGKNWWRFTFTTETRTRLKKFNFTLTLNYFENGAHKHTSNTLHLKKRVQPKKKAPIFHTFNEQQIKTDPSNVQIPSTSIEKNLRSSSSPLPSTSQDNNINHLLNGGEGFQ